MQYQSTTWQDIMHSRMRSLKKKMYPILYFLKVKYYTKRKKKEKEKEKINHSKVHNLNTNYYLKYL